MLIGLLGQRGTGKSTIARHLVEQYGFVEIGLLDVVKRFIRDVFGFSDKQLWGSSEEQSTPDTRYPKPTLPVIRWYGDKQIQPARPSNMVMYGPPESFRRARENIINPEQPATSPREIIERFGTEAGRVCYEEVWIRYALSVASRLNRGGYQYEPTLGMLPLKIDPEATPRTTEHNVVLTDLTSMAEIKVIRSLEGRIVRVTRPRVSDKLVPTPNGYVALEANVPVDATIVGPEGHEALTAAADTVFARLGLHPILREG
jgi:hypothetical protein